MNSIGGIRPHCPPLATRAAAGPKPAAPAGSEAPLVPKRRVALTEDGREIQLPGPGQRLSLGRHPQSSVVFEHHDVSRQHAEIVEKDGRYWLRDLNSSNGTLLNGQLIEAGKWVPYQVGDSVQLGDQAQLSQVELESFPGLQLPQTGQALNIGRAPENELRLHWPQTSRSHAVIQEKDGRHWLYDPGSSDGTYLNGQRIPSRQWVTVQPGQHVQFARGTEAFELRQRENASFTALDPLAAQAVLARAQTGANPIGFRAFGTGECTPDFLAAQGLEPRHSFSLDGQTKIHLSQPYSLEEGRVGCVAYVEDRQGQVHIRSFYRSHSQGLWRSASHAGMGGWIGKGNGESSTNLPIALQKHLQQQSEAGVKALSVDDSRRAFYGALEFRDTTPPEDLARQLQPERQLGAFQQPIADSKHGLPESFRWQAPGDAPDFNQPEDRYSFQHPLHGQVEAHCFSSHNGDLQYLFLNDSAGRSWLAQVETQSELTGWGTRTTPVQHGSLAMPAVEYADQIPPGYAGAHVQDSYREASDYVHRLPPVADFRRSQGKL